MKKTMKRKKLEDLNAVAIKFEMILAGMQSLQDQMLEQLQLMREQNVTNASTAHYTWDLRKDPSPLGYDQGDEDGID